ncbi:MFS transporter [Arthrobacter glacialis]|uniref:MFS transporter n=2 Tax=Arthrobacter glacialis TaxID=1664 RepID=UPI001FAEEEE7|nr:MFS transporter [Arthrobacter glacialis]
MQGTTAAKAAQQIDDVLANEKRSMLKQPKAVWAVAFAAVFAFMGIGLVDPILPAIAENLDATPSEVSLLFTSYFLVTAIAMLITGFVSSRIGGKKTLLIGLGIIVVFSALSGFSNTVDELVGFRAGWGLGNALFVATSLAVMVGVASGGAATAIILYEAALGLGLSLGPLMGALLGGWQWRAPFFGTATAMAIAFILVIVMLPKAPLPATKTRLRDPLLALGHKGLRTTAGSALFYNYGFFTILAFVPFILGFDAYGIGAVFFGWGVAVAVFSVFVAPLVQRWFGPTRALTGSLLGLMVILIGLALAAGHSVTTVVVLTVLSGALLGINNTLFTEMAMSVSDSPRPVASAGYNFIRWMGGALAPFMAAKIAEHVNASATFYVAAAAVLISAVVIFAGRKLLTEHAPLGV